MIIQPLRPHLLPTEIFTLLLTSAHPYRFQNRFAAPTFGRLKRKNGKNERGWKQTRHKHKHGDLKSGRTAKLSMTVEEAEIDHAGDPLSFCCDVQPFALPTRPASLMSEGGDGPSGELARLAHYQDLSVLTHLRGALHLFPASAMTGSRKGLRFFTWENLVLAPH